MKWYKGQGIETRFFCVLLPLIPLDTLFVHHIIQRQRSGIGMDLHWLSVFKTYLTWWPAPLAIALSVYTEKNYFLIGVGALISLASCFLIGLAGKKERHLRTQLHEALQMNALPHWLDSFNLQHIKAEALRSLRVAKNDPLLNWQLVRPGDQDLSTLRLLLVQAMYQYAIRPESTTLHRQKEILAEINQKLEDQSSSTGKPS